MPERTSNPQGSGAGLEALARFTASIDTAALPVAIVRRAQACLLYGLAVATASAETKPPHMAAAALDAEGHLATGRSTRLLDGKRNTAVCAAFANAVLMHARTQEDAHPAGHLGVVIVPAALALAEHVDASGNELLAAIVAGYEVALRIGRDHVADASRRGLRSTPLYGVFGAAAAASRLLRLGPHETMNALGLAANAAGGLREFVQAGTEEFPFHAGMAARNGISAAFLAQAEVVAAPTSLDGAAGFFRAFGDAGTNYGRRIEQRLGQDFELEQVTYKPYPTCQFHRSVVRGVLHLRERSQGAELQSMRIRMHPFEADFFGVRYAGPYTSFSQTFMSAPYCAALAWSSGAVTYRGLHDFEAPATLRTIARVEVIADPERSRYMPHIALRYADGKECAWEERAGAEDFRLTWEAAETMTRALAREAGVPEASELRLVESIRRLPGSDTVAQVISACRSAIAQGSAHTHCVSQVEEIAK